MEEKKSIWENALTILIIPALLYAYTYCYEMGYANHYKLPLSLISISTDSLFVLLIPTAILYYFIFSFDMLVSGLKTWLLDEVKEKYITMRLSRNIFMLLYTSIVFLIVIFLYDNYIVLVANGLIFSFFLIRVIALSIELYKKKKGIIPWELEKEYKPDSSMLHTQKILGVNAFALVVTMFFVGSLVYQYGQYRAQKQSEYFIINDNAQRIVIKKNGSSYIAVDKMEYLRNKLINFYLIKESDVEKIASIQKSEIKY